jgi:hypothetical protein
MGMVTSCNGVILKKHLSVEGYFRIVVRYYGVCKNIKVHRMQAYQKYGDALYKDGIIVRHLNGVSTDNSYDNIAIGTMSENMMDIPASIRIAKSVYAASFLRRYNKEDVMKFYIENGKSYKKTMEKFNISSKGTLHFILNGRGKK